MIDFLDAISSHIEELRKRLMKIAVVFVLSMVLGMILSGKLITLILENGPLKKLQVHSFSPWDSIQIYVQMATLVALVITLPFALWQIWLFVRPGLTKMERKSTLKYIPFATILFVSGIAFGYIVAFFMALTFTDNISVMLNVQQLYGISEYFTFLFNVVLPIGILFELPVLVLFLTQIHVLTPDRMKSIRKGAYMVLVIIGVVFSPPDFISDFLLIVPLISLYEFSLLLCKVKYKKYQSQISMISAEG